MGTYAEIFLTFAKIGSFTIGGGFAMVQMMEKEVVDNKHWLSHEEFMNTLEGKDGKEDQREADHGSGQDVVHDSSFSGSVRNVRRYSDRSTRLPTTPRMMRCAFSFARSSTPRAMAFCSAAFSSSISELL